MKLNWKLIFILPVGIIEGVAVLTTGKETGLGNWCVDRQIGDPIGKLGQTRKDALTDQHTRSLK